MNTKNIDTENIDTEIRDKNTEILLDIAEWLKNTELTEKQCAFLARTVQDKMFFKAQTLNAPDIPGIKDKEKFITALLRHFLSGNRPNYTEYKKFETSMIELFVRGSIKEDEYINTWYKNKKGGV